MWFLAILEALKQRAACLEGVAIGSRRLLLPLGGRDRDSSDSPELLSCRSSNYREADADSKYDVAPDDTDLRPDCM